MEAQIQQAWQDVLQDAPFELLLVRPSPPGMHPNIVAHVIVLQRPQANLCSVLLTIYDYTSTDEGTVMQMAITLHEHIRLEHLIHSLGRTQQCLLAGSSQICHAWHDAQPIQLGTPWPGRDGSGIVMTFMHRQPFPAGPFLLQLGHAVTRTSRAGMEIHNEPTASSERLTRDSVAQVHGPELRRAICLTTLLSADGKTKAIRLIAGHHGLDLPTYIEVSSSAMESDVEDSLRQWGLNCSVIQFGVHDRYLCFREDFRFDKAQVHYMFANEDTEDNEGVFLHSQPKEMSTLDIMKFLDTLGYPRAVVLDTHFRLPGIYHVMFCNSVPMPPVKSVREKVRTPWPPRLVQHWKKDRYSISEKVIFRVRHNKFIVDLIDMISRNSLGQGNLSSKLISLELTCQTTSKRRLYQRAQERSTIDG